MTTAALLEYSSQKDPKRTTVIGGLITRSYDGDKLHPRPRESIHRSRGTEHGPGRHHRGGSSEKCVVRHELVLRERL